MFNPALPFLLQMGVYNSLAWTLLMYGVRYVGYSYTNCAWYAFPFEALEVFTFAHLQVASAKFVRDYSPPGALATLTGITGGAHNGLGKGLGGLIGGVIIEITKNTKTAFWYFGLFAFGCGSVYGLLVNILVRLCHRKPPKPVNQDVKLEDISNADSDNIEPLMDDRTEADGNGETVKEN